VDLDDGSEVLEVVAEMGGSGCECEVSNVDGRGAGKSTSLSFRAIIMGPIPVQLLLCGIGIEEGRCTCWWGEYERRCFGAGGHGDR